MKTKLTSIKNNVNKKIDEAKNIISEESPKIKENIKKLKDSTEQNLKEGMNAVSRKVQEEIVEINKKNNHPIFNKEDIIEEHHPVMIRVIQADKRKELSGYENAIGFMKFHPLNILEIYENKINEYNYTFYPYAEQSVFYVDTINNCNFINLEEYFTMVKKAKVNESIEKYSVQRSLLAVERADVCLMMIDANDGVTDQDAKIAGEAHEAGKGVIIVVNKWDEYEKTTGTLEKYKKEVYEKLSYLSYAPMIFISAKTGQWVDKLFDMINNVAKQNALRVSTSVLNQVINEAIAIVQPPTDKGRRLKIYYGTQASTKPPTFVIFVNNKQLFHFSYQRYLVNQIRKEFGLEGTPVRMIAREKNDP